MRKIIYLTIILLFVSGAIYSLDSQHYIVSVEKAVDESIEMHLQQLQEDFSSLHFTILTLEIDDATFDDRLLVSSTIIFTAPEKEIEQELLFFVESVDEIDTEYSQRISQFLPSILFSLYNLEKEGRVLYQRGALLSATSEDEEIDSGSIVVTKDRNDSINTVMEVSDRIGSTLYLTSLWANTEYVDYMKIEKGANHSVSIIPMLSLDFVSTQVSYTRSLFSLIAYQVGLEALYEYDSHLSSLYVHGGLLARLPLSVLFTPDTAQRWYQHISLKGSAYVSVGIASLDDMKLGFQGGLMGSLEYLIQPYISVGVTMGWKVRALFDTPSVSESHLIVGPALTVSY